jgi:hypothetical protein
LKYSEEIVRHAAVNTDGMPCEILERITFVHELLADGTLGAPMECNRRFDLKTGERVNRLAEGEFELDLTGVKLRLQR